MTFTIEAAAVREWPRWLHDVLAETVGAWGIVRHGERCSQVAAMWSVADSSSGTPARTMVQDDAVSAEVQSAVGGDGEAYARIIRRYQDLLAQRMTRFSRHRTEVEELVHDVFVEAYFSLRRYRGDAPLEHWLQRIATRVGYRFWKRQRRSRTISLHESKHELQATTDAGSVGDVSEDVAILLEQLPPRDRLVLTLMYVESRSVAESAELAGWSQTMVKVQAHRARKKLRKLILASPQYRALVEMGEPK